MWIHRRTEEINERRRRRRTENIGFASETREPKSEERRVDETTVVEYLVTEEGLDQTIQWTV